MFNLSEYINRKSKTVGAIQFWGETPIDIDIVVKDGVMPALASVPRAELPLKPGEVALITGLGYPHDGVYEMLPHTNKTTAKANLALCADIELEPGEYSAQLYVSRSWPVYRPEFLPMSDALALSKIREVDKAKIAIKDELMQAEIATLALKAEGQRALINKVQSFATMPEVVALKQAVANSAADKPVNVDAVVTVLNQSDYACLRAIGVKLQQDFNVADLDLEQIGNDIVQEWLSVDEAGAIQTLVETDYDAMLRMRMRGLDETARQIDQTMDIVSLLAIEINYLCRMPWHDYRPHIAVMETLPYYGEMVNGLYNAVIAMFEADQPQTDEGASDEGNAPSDPKLKRK